MGFGNLAQVNWCAETTWFSHTPPDARFRDTPQSGSDPPRVVASGLGLPEVVREPTPQENRAQHPARLVGTDIYEIFSLSLRILYAHPAMLRLPPLLS